MATTVIDHDNGRVLVEVVSDFTDPTETEMINLSNGRWIEIHKELDHGQSVHVASAGFKSVIRGRDDTDDMIEIRTDYEALKTEKILTWLTDWNMKDRKGRVLPVSHENILHLRPSTAAEIEQAIDDYVAERDRLEEAAKKGTVEIAERTSDG